MPNKTLYVRDADLQLFERAQEELGESVSSLFAEFLRERLTSQTEPEKKALKLLKQIRADRKSAEDDGAKGPHLDYDRAESYAEKLWSCLKRKDFETARDLWFGAQSWHRIANRDVETYREIKKDIGRTLGG